MNNGFVIIAENNSTVNYVECAIATATSIKNVMPDSSITLLTNSNISSQIFDHVIKLPYQSKATNEWRLDYDWQIYECTPYEHTIKIEADFIIPRSIDHWWNILTKKDLVLCTTIRDFKGDISDDMTYREMFLQNSLPNTYNALTYFRKSTTAETFFYIVKDIFENWQDYKTILKYCPDEFATTDVVYGIAAKFLGIENCIIPNFVDFSFTHMKKSINNLKTNDWTKELIYEIDKRVLKINTFPQLYPFHYHMKHFANIYLNKIS